MTTVLEYGHVERVRVHFDDLDPMGIVHNARYALLLERALAPYWSDRGISFDGGRPTHPDAFNAVAEFTIGFRAPIRGTGEVAVHFWLDRFGETSAVYGFRILSTDHATVYAEGTRAVVRLDPKTMRPTPWTPVAREIAATLLKTREPVHAEEAA